MIKKSLLYSGKFYEFFKKNFSKDIKRVEELRKKLVKNIIIVTILSAFLISALIFSGIDFSQDFGQILFFFSVMIPVIVYNYFIGNYRRETKSLVLDKLFSFISDFKQVDKNMYRNQDNCYIKSLNLFDDYNRYNCDDRLKGTYKDLPIDIIELSLKKVVRAGKHRREIHIFGGIFIKIPSTKKFKGYTIIKRNKINIGFDRKKVNLEDPEFEKIYDVYSTNQVEARYLLTTAFMERMVQLKKENKDIILSFEKGYINIGLSSQHNWFELPIFKQATDIKQYRNILIELITILSIIDTLKLDNKIGL